MSASTTFAQHARVQVESSNVSEKPEEWEMSDNVMMHLFAQVRHIQARITHSTLMHEVSALVASRSMVLNFQIALGCAVMIEWCYLREMSGLYEDEYYAALGAAWDERYEACKKHYNAPNEVLQAALDACSPLPTVE